MNNNRRPISAYNRFVREQAPLRPTTTTPTEWMREVGRRWRNRHQEPLVPADANAQEHTKECIICYVDQPRTQFYNGPCQHHEEICEDCTNRVVQCPVCRLDWVRPERRRQPQPQAVNTPVDLLDAMDEVLRPARRNRRQEERHRREDRGPVPYGNHRESIAHIATTLFWLAQELRQVRDRMN